MPTEFPFKIIDLTHPWQRAMPVWPGDPPVEITPAAEYGRDGFYLNALSCGEHSGTHAGAPVHFYAHGLTMAGFPAERLIVPLIKITASLQKDELLQREAVFAWQKRHGVLPPSSAVVIETGWSRHWPEVEAYFAEGEDGRMHFPGISEEAMLLLVEERGVRTVGIDTAGLDGGLSADYRANKVLARRSGLHIENLTNLDRVPPAGAWLVIGALPIMEGSGSPARVLALIPSA